ncbi:MAG: hypothetical protein K2X73_02555 [Sphingomonas sp.]|jgi:diacylglycerol kinase family enzyme|uniref:diacylglycerol/lipid kinase family protein n=1 Tax=Sphingomonas sp. TaxID=28214 RepID=UPI0025ED260F|nr:diacylglycerol kinase family protein [Sphingomonas sp.]MBX9880834.1 hypothetical protein [Sphingomonas sp.]
MQRLWFITNPGSGSASEEKCEALEALFGERGLQLGGRTRFPDEDLPQPGTLDSAGIDTVVLFAGDGTINAAACALADWRGDLLILPGGTMNLLAKLLHGEAEPADIIHAAHQGAERIALPYVEAGQHRAFVGLILGPAASWVRAREAARAGKLRQMLRAARGAWGRTFGQGLRLRGLAGLPRRVQAVFVQAVGGRLRIAAIDARDWGSILALGWEFLTGDWVNAAAVTEIKAPELRTAERRPVLALFDGEPVMIEPDLVIRAGETRPQFLKTA